MRLKDLKIAAVKLPRCLGGDGESGVGGTKSTRGQFEETGAPSNRELDTILDSPGFIACNPLSFMHSSL